MWEQPRVSFAGEVSVTVTGVRGQSQQPPAPQPFRATWTSAPSANDALPAGELRGGAVLRSSATDADGDGVADELRLSVALPLAGDEQVTGASLVARLAVSLRGAAALDMDALAAAAGGGGGAPGSAWHADGDAALAQRGRALPAAPRGAAFAPYARAPLPSLANDSALLPAGGWPAAALAAYRRRGLTLALAVPADGGGWAADATPAAALPAAAAAALEPRAFVAALTLRVPRAPLRVAVGAAAALKWALVQYVALLAPALCAAWAARAALFGYGVLETSVFVDAPRAKLHAE